MFCILVADDDAKTLKSADQILTEAGYKTELCKDGRVALSALKANKFDVVILDSIMPFINGREIATYIRENINLKNLPIIFMTGDRHPEEFENLVESKLINICLPKPFQSSQLLNLVAILINQKR